MSKTSLSIDDEWNQFNSEGYQEDDSHVISKDTHINEEDIPIPTDIYISTKSKIAYLDREIDLKKVFWAIPISPYSTAGNCIVKKQMKFNSLQESELAEIQENLKKAVYYEEQVITSINNPTGRIRFKDIRKVSIGISKKDIMSYRSKKKSAFYNCFVLIMRLKVDTVFKEFHIKVFNTGKLEIPGIQNDDIFESVLNYILVILQPHIQNPLGYLQKSDTILINSNFNCGFYINREVLFDILKFKYNIQAIYDPCSYPGVQCKFYYNPGEEVQTGYKKASIPGEILISKKKIEISFMIFRTGSILIVGMCEDDVLYKIYEFLKKILHDEYHRINQPIAMNESRAIKDKKRKIKRKTIHITVEK
jgi:hypothetical protein